MNQVIRKRPDLTRKTLQDMVERIKEKGRSYRRQITDKSMERKEKAR